MGICSDRRYVAAVCEGRGAALIPAGAPADGQGYVYADRGEVLLKGFEDAVRLYEARWRE